MGIAKELSYLVYPVGVKGIRHVDTDAITSIIDSNYAQIANDQNQIKDLIDQVEQKKGSLTSCLSSLTATNSVCKNQIADLITKNNTQADIILGLQQSVKDCANSFVTPPLPQTTLDLMARYYTKYPEAHIQSDAHYVGINKVKYMYDVQDWCMMGRGCPEFTEFINRINANVSKIMKNETNGDYHKACDLAVARIAVNTEVDYHYDNEIYGVDDYWAWALDTFMAGKGDCDDYSAMRYVLNATAGVSDRLMRIACGNTRGNNEGHSTNFYYSSDLFWHHINSTTSFGSGILSDATLAPKENDVDDPMGLNYIWYSFNSERSWQGFTTSSQRDAFDASKQHRLLRKVKITPIVRVGSSN